MTNRFARAGLLLSLSALLAVAAAARLGEAHLGPAGRGAGALFSGASITRMFQLNRPRASCIDGLAEVPWQEALTDRHPPPALWPPFFPRPQGQTVLRPFISRNRADILSWALRPGATDEYLGGRFAVNSDGFLGPDVDVRKPAGVRRIAVIGNSLPMGYGVDMRDSFPVVLERRLNAAADKGGARYEVLNFSVVGYTAAMMLEQLDRKVLKYRPDLVLFCLTPWVVERDMTSYYDLRTQASARYLSKHVRGYGNPYLRRIEELAREAGLETGRASFLNITRERRVRESVSYGTVILRRFSVVAARAGSRCSIMYATSMSESDLAFASIWDGLAVQAEALGIPSWDATAALSGDFLRYRIVPDDFHPNAQAHRIYADLLCDRVRRASSRRLSHARRDDHSSQPAARY